ncbi:MAG: type II toxin-antitoxin system antitoxin DNA ADP-ribosyl glycohydrolase DarG [bacterium]
MIQYAHGDILGAQADALVNTVNCVGIMGRGIAFQFKSVYPANFKAYAAACKRGLVQPGRMMVFETGQLTGPGYIINFPTKRHWRGKSRIEDIETGLTALAGEVRARGIRSIAIPALGSGLGGLDWAEVRPMIEKAFVGQPELKVLIYEPDSGLDDSRANRSRAAPKMTAGRAALVSLMNRYLAALMDPTITLLEVHKLMYFLQAAGEPLRLSYVKAPYGPYAENLRHVLHEIEGHLISGYGGDGDAPEQQLTLVPGAVKDAEAFLQGREQTHARFERVARLTEGFETPFGLELLATVHWVATQEHASEDKDMVRATYDWSARKRCFSPAQIALAAGRLRSQDWL